MVKGPQERVAQIVGFAMGAATGVTASALATGFEPQRRGPKWIGLVLLAATVLVVACVRRLRRDPRVQVLMAAFLPFAAAGAAARALELSRETGRTVAGVGTVVALLTLFAIAFVFSRHKREVDQLVFREASLVAFFATVIASVVYGSLTRFTDVPDVSLLAVGLFGLGVWTVALFVLDRKYS
jgi:FtsH-binding integral membrane protein